MSKSKGISLPVEYLIIIIIAVVVLLAVIVFFLNGFDFLLIQAEIEMNKACAIWNSDVSNPCSDDDYLNKAVPLADSRICNHVGTCVTVNDKLVPTIGSICEYSGRNEASCKSRCSCSQ